MINQRLSWLLILTLGFPGLVLSAAEKSPHDLSSIKKEIAAVQSEISHDEKNLNTLNTQLKTSEKNISSLTLKITQLSKKIEAQQSQLIPLKAKKKEYDTKIQEQQNTLEQLIAANYSLQRQGRLGIYFSGQSADQTERFLKYYQALDAAVISHIHQIRGTILQLNKVMVSISSKTTQLQRSLSDYKNEVLEVKKAQINRQTAISSIHHTLNTHRKVLDQLLLDRKQLTTLVTHLATTEQMSHLSFSTQKGQLHWPVQGDIKYLFLKPMANESVRWQGDLIEAKAGTPVHAIYSGKVIYADWLRGYGLLVIIDHGSHYLSLYARNDTLNHKVGDYIEGGEVIGTVGQSGGFQDPALYFEMRHNTQAINPRDWFKKS